MTGFDRCGLIAALRGVRPVQVRVLVHMDFRRMRTGLHRRGWNPARGNRSGGARIRCHNWAAVPVTRHTNRLALWKVPDPWKDLPRIYNGYMRVSLGHLSIGHWLCSHKLRIYELVIPIEVVSDRVYSRDHCHNQDKC